MTEDTLKRANEIKNSINDRWINIENLDEFDKWMILDDEEPSLWTLKKGDREIDLWIAPSEFRTLYNYELRKIDELKEEFENL